MAWLSSKEAGSTYKLAKRGSFSTCNVFMGQNRVVHGLLQRIWLSGSTNSAVSFKGLKISEASHLNLISPNNERKSFPNSKLRVQNKGENCSFFRGNENMVI